MALAAHEHSEGPWQPSLYALAEFYAPTPVPDRVVLTWSDDPATTQSVTWRTDVSVQRGVGEIGVANANGRALETSRVVATTEPFSSDINHAHYHSLTFRGLTPDTLYAYRVGDGVNWTEYFHFRTASARPEPFRFVYFGDAQNELTTHWSRVFREAFRDAPRAAFMLHAGDLINDDARDIEWGAWHGVPGWVNGTIPVVATPGNHEYYRSNRGPAQERFWTAKDGSAIAVDVNIRPLPRSEGREGYRIEGRGAGGEILALEIDDQQTITAAGGELLARTGYREEELVGTTFDDPPLKDRRRVPGNPEVSKHWRPQFNFPLQEVPPGLEETVYYIDYQGTRIVSLDSNRDREAQLPWLRRVLTDNPNRWTIVTFHHPIFSPASDRDNAALRALWKPLFDEFRVDLVLNGHDHTYARTGDVSAAGDAENVPAGYQQAYDPDIGTVYVVSVSGPKMYPITKGSYARRVAENTQLYQVIDVADGSLKYQAFTATGELYDAFTLEKRPDGPNRLRELLPPERRGDAP